MEIAEALAALTAADGPSGFEADIAALAGKMIAPYVDETHGDVMGNIIGMRKCGRKNAKKLLFEAHIDEIGFIITGIEEGFLHFSTLGGVDSRMLPSSGIKLLLKEPVYGVVCAMPPHVLKEEDSDSAVKTEDLVIDIGMTQEEAERAVPIGTPCVYDAEMIKLGGGNVCGKSLDDRACFAAIVRALELLKDEKLGVDLYVLASVQEEVGLRGAKTAAFAIAPDYCVSVDVGHAKTPDYKKYQAQEMNEGTVISIGPNMNRRFTEMIVSAAEKNGIKYQVSIEPDGNSGTNASVIQTAREGVATALLGIPLKYMHTPAEIISLDDAESLAKLLYETAKAIDGGDGND